MKVIAQEIAVPMPLDIHIADVHSASMSADVELHGFSVDVHQFLGMEQAIVGLSRIYSAACESIDSGHALSPLAARMLQVSVEAIAARVPGPKLQIVPALEHFNSVNRVLASRIAMEGVIDSIGKVAVKVAEFIKTIWAKIKEFLKSVFDRSGRILRDVEQAVTQVKELPSNEKPMAEYMGDDVATEDMSGGIRLAYLEHHLLFGIKGKCDGKTTNEIIDNTEKLILINREVILHMLDCLKMISDKAPDRNELETEATKLTSEIKDKMGRFDLLGKKHEGNKEIYSYGHFHDDHVFRLRIQTGMGEGDHYVKLFNVDLSVEKTKGEDYRVKVLSPAEMIAVGQNTVELVKRNEDLEKVIPIAEKVLHHTADVLHGHFNKAKTSEEREDVIDGLNMIHDMFRYVGEHLPYVAANATKVAADATTYVRASMKYYPGLGKKR